MTYAMDNITMIDFDSGVLNDDRLLVIDDNEDIADILEEVGLDAGYSVQSAHKPDQVKKIYQEFNPTVIFLDLGLIEDGSGYGDEGLDVLRYLSEQKCKARIVIISGKSRRKRELTQIQGQGLHLSMVGHISKPFDIDKIELMLIKMRGTERVTISD
jgi:CheY-like chemotaxis protein